MMKFTQKLVLVPVEKYDHLITQTGKDTTQGNLNDTVSPQRDEAVESNTLPLTDDSGSHNYNVRISEAAQKNTLSQNVLTTDKQPPLSSTNDQVRDQQGMHKEGPIGSSTDDCDNFSSEDFIRYLRQCEADYDKIEDTVPLYPEKRSRVSAISTWISL